MRDSFRQDFSLEQVDFALRRRFLWRLSTYDAKRLDEIISENIKDNNISESIPDNFSETCTDLNNEIEWENSLGKSYLIGHAFFSEIVDIIKQVKDWEKAKGYFILADVTIILLVSGCVILNSLRISRSNPVESLKNE